MRIALVLVGRTIPGFNNLVDSISHDLKSQVTTEMIDFPLTRSFRSKRQQYDAEALLKELGRLISPYVDSVVFVVREDMFSGKLNFVFGLALERACIVSTARLDPRFYGEVKDKLHANILFKERIVKEVLHELGHTRGLPHCEDRTCLMVFSNSIADVDFKKREFCERCRMFLYLKSQEG